MHTTQVVARRKPQYTLTKTQRPTTIQTHSTGQRRTSLLGQNVVCSFETPRQLHTANRHRNRPDTPVLNPQRCLSKSGTRSTTSPMPPAGFSPRAPPAAASPAALSARRPAAAAPATASAPAEAALPDDGAVAGAGFSGTRGGGTGGGTAARATTAAACVCSSHSRVMACTSAPIASTPATASGLPGSPTARWHSWTDLRPQSHCPGALRCLRLTIIRVCRVSGIRSASKQGVAHL